MTLLDRYKKTITFRVDKPKEAVCRDIINATKNRIVEVDNIKVIIKPTFFDPFAGRGYINLQLSDNDNGSKANIKCEIVPTSVTKKGIYILAFLLLLWTLLGLFISHNFYSFLTIAFGWIIMAAVIHLIQKLNQGKLESYIRFIISNIKPSTQKQDGA